MSEKTTRIYVDLTDEQMDTAASYEVSALVVGAVKAQRPRPIAVGDRVTYPLTSPHELKLEVEAVKDGVAWLWRDGAPWCWRHVDWLTRVDDEVGA